MDIKVSDHRTAVIAGTSAIASLIPVALHQLGGLSHLPDPPLSLFASDLITESRTAHPLGIPDSLLGIASYTASLFLLAGAPKSLFLKRLCKLKLFGDGLLATVNLIRQVVVFRKICSWCSLTVAATGVMVVAGQQSLR